MKKRIIALILSVLMLLSIMPLTAVSALMMGDVDGDGKLSAADARSVLRASVNLETLDGEAFKAADVDGDGKLSAADARSVLRASVSLESLHTHSFTGTVTTAAGCETTGVMTYTCECGQDSYTEVIPATGHTSVKYAAVAPTCTDPGKTEGAYCSVCNAVLTPQSEVPATGHVSSSLDLATVKKVTCKEDGYTGDEKCDKCGVVTKFGTVVPHTGDTHNMVEQYAAPTCETGGYYVLKCTACDHFDAESVREDGTAPAGHKWKNGGAYTTVAPTCDEQGYDTRTCSVEKCSYEERINFVPAKGHKYLPNANDTKAPTCQTNGYEKYECINDGCDYVRTDILDTVACDPSEKVVHSGQKSNNGVGGFACYTEYKCKYCHQLVSKVENYAAHRMFVALDEETGLPKITEVSCTTPAATEKVCEYCDYTEIVETQEALGHIGGEVKQPTCTEPGYIRFSGTCERCNEEIDAGDDIFLPAKGHKLTGVQTCETSVTCETCKAVVFEKFGHSYEMESSAITATGSDKTVSTFFCTRCGKGQSTNAEKIETFNAVVNKIKPDFYPSYYDRLHYFGKAHTETSYSKFNFGIYTSMIKDMYDEDMANTPDTYTPVRTVYAVQTVLPIDTSNVSELTVNDIDSITVERLSGVKFNNVLSSFDTKYTVGSKEYDLTAYKAISEDDSVIKVTIDVKNESFYKDIYNRPEGSKTSLQKIFEYDVDDEYSGFTMDESKGKLYFAESEKADGYEMNMKMYLNNLTTDGKVTYYFLEETYEPIIAVYDAYQTMEQDIAMNFKIGISIKGEMAPVIKSQNTTVFVFPEYLPQQ